MNEVGEVKGQMDRNRGVYFSFFFSFPNTELVAADYCMMLIGQASE